MNLTKVKANINLPAIPTVDKYQYKHYYILKDMAVADSYYLHILAYEPASMMVDGKGYIVALQKYGKQIASRMYTFKMGDSGWKHKGSYSTLPTMYNNFTIRLVYNNFLIDLEGNQFDENPLPDDQVVPAPVPEFPGIPFVDSVKYKHYYILQNQDKLESYYLHLLAYEPAKVEVSDKDYIVASQKYGRQIGSLMYSYTIGDECWKRVSEHSTLPTLYSNFAERLVYNNFLMDFEEDRYEENRMPDDCLIPAIEPVFPTIPYIDAVRYKHYYILQNPDKMESYYLHLLAYEPTFIEINEKGYIAALQKYGNMIPSKMYTFSVGQNGWKYYADYDTVPTLYDNFDIRLIYNNFVLDVGYDFCKMNEMPDDGVIPAPDPEFPPIPYISSEESTFCHYLMVQDTSALNTYTIFVLKEMYCHCQVTEKGYVEFLDEEDNLIEIRRFSYTIGAAGWGNHNKQFSINYASVSHFIEYCNFDIEAVDLSAGNPGYILQAPCHSYPNDGINLGGTRDGWTNVNGKRYYYRDGIKQVGWLKEDHLRSERTYLLNGRSNGEMVANQVFTSENTSHCFGINGVMAIGSYTLNGITYTTDEDGSIISQSPEYESYVVIGGDAVIAIEDVDKLPAKTVEVYKQGQIVRTPKVKEEKRTAQGQLNTQYTKIVLGKLQPAWIKRSQLRGAGSSGEGSGNFEDELRAQGFTDSYVEYLMKLHNKYPKWRFIADVDNVAFDKFVDAQYVGKQKCAEPGSSFGDGTSFREEPFYENATKDAISFFADPRAMLTSGSGVSGAYERVFQFLDYDQYRLSEDENEEILNNMISDSDLIDELMKVYQEMSPVMLGAIYCQENGPDGEQYTLNGVTKKVYNLFNVRADSGGGDALKYAHQQNWISRKACISGSLDELNAKFGRGQSTFYALDWNYKTFSTSGIIDKQYATLVTDAAKKGILICQKTGLTNLVNYEFLFRIPLYANLPVSVPSMPT